MWARPDAIQAERTIHVGFNLRGEKLRATTERSLWAVGDLLFATLDRDLIDADGGLFRVATVDALFAHTGLTNLWVFDADLCGGSGGKDEVKRTQGANILTERRFAKNSF